MDIAESIAVRTARLQENGGTLGPSHLPSDQKLIGAAKNFESILIHKLVETMQDTVGQWGGQKDSAFAQINGIFSYYLSQAVSEQGGLGLWKDLTGSLEQTLNSESQPGKLDQAL